MSRREELSRILLLCVGGRSAIIILSLAARSALLKEEVERTMEMRIVFLGVDMLTLCSRCGLSFAARSYAIITI